MGSWDVQWQAGFAPGVGAAAEVHDVLGAEGARPLSSNRGSVADRANEYGAVTELALLRLLQDLVKENVPCSWNVAFVPFPVVTHVYDFVPVFDQLLNLIQRCFSKRYFLVFRLHHLLLVLFS